MKSGHHRRWHNSLVEILVIAAVYFALARLGQILAIDPGNVTPIWPASGFALAVVMWRGYRVWPGLWLGNFLGNTWAFLDLGTFEAAARTLVTGLAIGPGDVLQACLGAYLIRRFCGGELFGETRNVFRFVGTQSIACLSSATFGVLALYSGNLVSWAECSRTWLTWYLGDAVGVILVAPVLLMSPMLLPVFRGTARMVEAATILILSIFASLIAFTDVSDLPLSFLPLPLVLWAAVRGNQFAVSATVLALSAVAIWAFATRQGPFVSDDLNFSLMLLQFYMAVTLVTGLAVAAALDERRRAERNVRDRTLEVSRTNKRLEHEISERKAVEAALRISEERFQLSVKGSTDGLWDWDVASNEVHYSTRFKELIGYQDDELENNFTSFESRLHPEDHDRTMKAVADHLERQMPYDVEYRLRTKSGEYRWFRARGQAIRDDAGRATRVAGSITDVTDRKIAEDALTERARLAELTADVGLALTQNADLSTILKACTEALVRHLDAAFVRIWQFNPAENMLELRASSGMYTHIDGPHGRVPLGKLKIGLIGSERKPHLTNQVVGDPRIGDQDWAKREGMVAFAGYPLVLGDRLMGVMALFARRPLSEITTRAMGAVADAIVLGIERKQAEEEVLAARKAAEAANRAKSDFLANMSHEIRTPMNAILGMTELVLDSQLSPEQREFLNVASEAGEALLDILNEILDFSKIEAGKLVLEPNAFDLHESLGDTLKSLGNRAHKKNLELACRISSSVPHIVVGDSARLRQIIINLVGNAIKFTETGEVIVEVDRQSKHNEQLTLRFAVSDTGIGIPVEKRETIFQAFEQADTSSTRRFGGTGLGLAICSQLIKLMGGRICVDSEPGRGSTFHFTALFGVASDKPPKRLHLDPARLRGVRVLIVDDSAANRRILEEILDNWEMMPSCASGGSEAITMVQRALADGDPYRLILTDSQMPETDGFDLAKQLRRVQKFDSAIIMMLTSGDRLGEIDRCQSLGLDVYIRKPVKQSELFEALSATLRQEVQTIESQKPDFAKRIRRFGSLRVLLAEDSLLNQKLVVSLLEKHGCTVQVAHNGREAVVALESEPFEVVLMDVQMPEMDGLEATMEIRCRERATGKHVPIIALTANALKGDRDRCLDAGMDEYVSKPVRAEQLFDTIALVLQGTSLTSKAEASDQPNSMVVDWDEAIQSVDGDHTALRDLIEAALEECPNMLEAVQRAVRARDEENLVLGANTLKGAIRYFGATGLFDRVFLLERMGRDGRLDGVEEIATAVSEDMQRLFQELRRYVRSLVI